MNEKEKRIKEERTREATKKGLMGISGRFGVIMRNLGSPIVLQGDSGGALDIIGFTRTEMPSAYPEDNENYAGLPTMEMLDEMGQPVNEPEGYGWTQKNSSRQGASVTTIGWHFDGLNRGMHLEMKYLEGESEIIVHYKGHLVYKEVGGDLKTYAPLPEWESWVNDLYGVAKIKDDKNKKIERDERIAEAAKTKESWLEKLRKNWGI
jgi:hypothetical protein